MSAAYLRIRRFIDWAILWPDDKDNPAYRHTSFALMLPLVPSFIAIPLVRSSSIVGHVFAALLFAGAIVLAGFVAWRCWRLSKAGRLYAARRYERHYRYFLPSEYADSEDALLAARRKKAATPPPRPVPRSR